MSAISGSNIAAKLYNAVENDFKGNELKSIASVLLEQQELVFNANLTDRIKSAYQSRVDLWTNALNQEKKRTGQNWNMTINMMRQALKPFSDASQHLSTFSIQNKETIEELRDLGASDPAKYAEAIEELRQANQDLATLVFFLSNPLYIRHKENKPSQSEDIDHLDEIVYPELDPFEKEVAELEAKSKSRPIHENQNFFRSSEEEEVSFNSDDEDRFADLSPLPNHQDNAEKKSAATLDDIYVTIDKNGPYYEGKEVVFKGSIITMHNKK